jgi:hypothetical protein
MDGTRTRRLAFAVARKESAQTTTEYAVVLAVLLLGLGAVIFTLEPTIQSFIGTVGEKIAAILS